MLSSLLLPALLILPCALQQQTKTVDRKLDDLAEWLERWKTWSSETQVLISANQVEIHGEVSEILAIVGATQNATSQLRAELDTLRGRQAASAAVQASQVLMLVVYFLTIISIYVVKRCRKVREKSQRKEFELLEKQLRSSKAKRRAAAAKEKSAPAPSQE